MKRKKLIIGNWKMNLDPDEAKDLVISLKNDFSKYNKVDIVVSPPFIYLTDTINILNETKIQVCAQNTFHKEEGAFTGEVSPKMLKEIGTQMVIIGHSERRQIFKENEIEINLKIKSALKYGLTPVLCVGEDLNTRERGGQETWVTTQVLSCTQNLKSSDVEKMIIAYEPIWAIGTGKICKGEDALKIIKSIRNTIKGITNKDASEKIRILYGGSIKSNNFQEHIKHEDIDGGLVGGSSLIFEEFSKIINLASNVYEQNLSQPV